MADPSIHRLTSLAFALLGSTEPRSSGWIRTNVDGYPPTQSREAFNRMLQRDVQTIRRAGVPVRQLEAGYQIEPDDYELSEVTFTPAEAQVLGLAGELGASGELGVFARSGWTKLAAAGAARDLRDRPVYHTDTDANRVPAQLITAVNALVKAGERMTFDYQAVPRGARVKRTMDPWSLVTWNNRIYLVGWDVDRQAPRSFRALRVSNVRRSREAATRTEPTESPQDVVRRSLVRGRDVVDATVAVPVGTAKELVDAGQRDGDLVRLEKVDRDWLVRTTAGYAPDVEVIEPHDIRVQVVQLLQGGI